MLKILNLFFVPTCIILAMFFFYYLILTEVMKKDVYKLLFRVNWGNLISNIIFFIITFIVFFFAFVFAYAVPEGINAVTEYYMNVSGLSSVLILSLGGEITKKLYMYFTILIKRIIPRYRLHYISENNRMWSFLIVSLIFCIITLTDERTQEISYIAFSVITGKIFWIENKKSNLKNFFLSFFNIPHWIGIIYIMFIYCSFVFYRFETTYMTKSYCQICMLSSVVGFFIYYVFCIIKNRKQIKSDILKEIEKRE